MGLTLYTDGWAPSPRRVEIFLAEKAIAVERVAVDIRRNAQLDADYLAVNPRGSLPALRLESGELLTESVAICRYFEALHPEPPLFGRTPLEIARIESWTRRIEQEGYAAIVYAFRNGHPVFAGRGLPGAGPAVPQVAELVARGQAMWAACMAALEEQLAANAFVAGEAFSFADIMALTTIDFARMGRLAVPDDGAIAAWRAQVNERPSIAV